ncbi:MAG: retroviral-like aspartic protease family protein [Burkholderiales bacterium]|nr:retroviral-like aspartic protease family protein [Burkholderiales bacterium]MDE2396757.1 retroviral-like aspartic protease family protein [Burkholderiales bacterium]MDE2456790.1 retroviral-like aspartic protease family protein [Burkholderiales bacterium]
MGSKALLVIDGQTRMLSPGEAAAGVRLVEIRNGEAVVESDGRRVTLELGGAPAQIKGTPAPAGAREIVIPAGPGGHFVVAGSINGHAVRFMIDTGATLVALSQGEAERIGLDYRGASASMIQTANGAVPVRVVTLSSLRVGSIELANVGAVVVPSAMPMVLLGNSFLSRLQMKREADVMRLQMR